MSVCRKPTESYIEKDDSRKKAILEEKNGSIEKEVSASGLFLSVASVFVYPFWPIILLAPVHVCMCVCVYI